MTNLILVILIAISKKTTTAELRKTTATLDRTRTTVKMILMIVTAHRRMRIAQSGSFVKKFTISDSAETPQISHRNAGAYISAQFMTIFCFKGLEKAPDIMGKEEISIFLKNSSISSFFIFLPKIQFLAKP